MLVTEKNPQIIKSKTITTNHPLLITTIKRKKEREYTEVCFVTDDELPFISARA